MIDSGSQMTICNTALRSLISDFNRRSRRDDASDRVNLETLLGGRSLLEKARLNLPAVP